MRRKSTGYQRSERQMQRRIVQGRYGVPRRWRQVRVRLSSLGLFSSTSGGIWPATTNDGTGSMSSEAAVDPAYTAWYRQTGGFRVEELDADLPHAHVWLPLTYEHTEGDRRRSYAAKCCRDCGLIVRLEPDELPWFYATASAIEREGSDAH